MHLPPLIKDLALILALAAVSALIFRRLRLPTVIGYLLAGFVVGPNSLPFPRVSDMPNIHTWAEIGVIILMFSLGLEFSFRRLMRSGLTVVISALVQVTGLLYLGYGVGKLIGWNDSTSLFMGAMLSISSTTIIAKSFEELELKTKRFAESVLGILIVEDLIAILMLVVLATPKPEEGISGLLVLTTLGQMLLVVGSWFVFGYYFLPRFLRQAGQRGTDETMTILAVALCFLLATFATAFHFSSALGAFIMGSILSESTESHRIENLIKPIRDLFLAVFFVSIGMMIDPKSLVDSWTIIILFTLVVIVGKIFFNLFGGIFAGQSPKDALRCGFSLAQIGEFSFILATLAIQKGSIDSNILSIAVSVSLISTFLTPWMIQKGIHLSNRMDAEMPPKIKAFLIDYQDWWIRSATAKEQQKRYLSSLMVWGLNGLVVTTVFALTSEYLLPYASDYAGKPGPLIAWILAFVLSLPFIWGMFVAFSRRIKNPDVTAFVLKHSSRVGVLFLVATLSGAFFRTKYAFVLIVIGTIVSLVILYRRLEGYYQEFERKFVYTFKSSDQAKKAFSGLSPWDAHLSTVAVQTRSLIAGMTLAEANIRQQTGASIVNVRRGGKDFVAPLGSFRLFPQDEILALGTDDQIQKLLVLCKAYPDETDTIPQDFEIRPILLGANHSFDGKKVRELGLQEHKKSILVGLERNGQRILSPPSDFEIRSGDLVWIVGPTSQLDTLV